jgi:hypothetical protein
VRHFAALVALTAAGLASAQEEPDWSHRGALGLLVSGGGEYVTSAGNAVSFTGFLAPLELGGTFSITEHTELRAAARLSVPGPLLGSSFYFGIRNSRGERFKTFFDLDLAVHATPIFTAGLRLGLGVQYEVLPVLGIFAVAGVQGGGGAGLRLSFELLLGVQFRTYVLGG